MRFSSQHTAHNSAMSVVLSRFDLIKGCVHPKQRPNHTFTQEPLHNQECEYVHTHMHTHLHSSWLGWKCFVSRLALTLSLLRVFTHTHTQHIFIVSQTHFVCSLSVRIVRFCRRTNTFKKVYCFRQLCIIYLKTQVWDTATESLV